MKNVARFCTLPHMLCVAVLAASGCERRNNLVLDAATDVVRPDGPLGMEAAPSALAVEFTATGCSRTGDAGVPTCRGYAPVTVAFVPLVTGALTEFLWQVGDQTVSTEPNPVITFDQPGIYDVTLVAAGPFGSVSRTITGFITVLANPLGQPCDADVQCETKLCLCGSSAKCSKGAFPRGICTTLCNAGVCPGASMCADLGRSGPITDESPWRQSLCLQGCQTSEVCPVGQICRELPGTDGSGSWPRACFAEEPSAMGAPCRTPIGDRSDTSCVGGVCLDVGAHALCSQDCKTLACPAGTGCAQLTGDEHRCVPLCGETYRCTHDALLQCLPSGSPGPRGFTVAGAPAGATYCMPVACKKDADCGLGGRCLMENSAGNCIRR